MTRPARDSPLYLTVLPSFSIILSAFLLFLVQPMIAKLLLPVFGGSAAVWTSCLVFFQVVLLFGYSYSHLSIRRFKPKTQAIVHLALLTASMFALPLQLRSRFMANAEPSLAILVTLGLSVGLPYFVLSSNTPLTQAWIVRGGMPVPYRLYALSNVASLVALLAYPVAIEPWLGIREQSLAWTLAFAVYAVASATLAFRQIRWPVSGVATASWNAPALAIIQWLALSACGSVLLLAVTNHLLVNVAAVPFLWVLPLTLYLATFAICFQGWSWPQRPLVGWITAIFLVAMTLEVLRQDPSRAIRIDIPLYCAGLFVCCLFLHGRLAAAKPGPERLTLFYLMLALGGALGAILVGVIAPHVFQGTFELPLGLAACGLIGFLRFYRRSILTDLIWLSLLVMLVAFAWAQIKVQSQGFVAASRNFYGTLRISDKAGVRSMIHGPISHGSEFLDDDKRREPTTYYSRASAAGLALSSPGAMRRIGVIGLGAGTLATYGREGDVIRFYEINPLVVEYARRYFRYLPDSLARIQMRVGDGRLILAEDRDQKFDFLVVDAFSGDSIPVHLLTREAFVLYRQRLLPGGILLFHISNSNLDFAPLVQVQASAQGLQSILVVTPEDASKMQSAANWMAVGEAANLARYPALIAAGRPVYNLHAPTQWTDDYSNLFQLLR